jgi:hypothetical protein
MTDPGRLQPGARHKWRVVQHAPFGLVVESVDLPEPARGVIDVVFMSEETRGHSQEDFPPLGTVLEAVVQGYTPAGQLRLSMTPPDGRDT